MLKCDYPTGLLVKVEKTGGAFTQPAIRGLAIGYYDCVSIHPMQKWFEFSPDHLHDGNDGGTYMMKLCCPSEPVRAKLEQQGLCYDRWVNDLEALVDEKPCVSVVLINLMDSFKYPDGKDTHSDLFSDILLKLVELLELPADELQAASCCILPSLGYSDYGILFAEKSWNLALRLMSKLHQIKDANGQPILSTDYSIPAYFGTTVPETGSLFPENVQLASRLTLKPGYTPEHIAHVVNGQDIQVYEINDTADCLLISKGRPEHLLRNLLQIRGILPEGEVSLRDMVISSKSRFHQKVDTTALNGVDPLPEAEIPYLTALKNTLCQYREQLSRFGMNLRQSNALLETTSSLYQVCTRPHNKDLREALEPLVNAFTFCMNGVNQILADADRPEELPSNIWEELDHTLNTFRERVGGFVSDLTRSDCFSMEREQYNHPSVGSGTMLLLGLNRIINELSREIQQHSGYEKCEHGFLLTSGGCDTTLTHRMFDFLQPDEFDSNDDPVESLPFVMQVAEIGLFDSSSTMLRLVHEIMHVCGDRCRKNRALLIQKFLSIWLGTELASALFREDQRTLEDMLHTQKTGSSSSFDSALQEHTSALGKVLTKMILDNLQQRWDAMGTDRAELQMSFSYIDWLRFSLNDIFEGASRAFRLPETEMCKTPLAEKMLSELVSARAGLWYDWAQVWNREFGVSYSRCNLVYEKNNYWREQLDASPIPYLSFYRTLQDTASLLNEVGSNSTAHVEDVFYIFSESFSDFSAHAILGSQWVDYLLCFLMENGSVEQVMPDSLLNRFRIPFVLRSVYGLSGSLADSGNAQVLQEAVEALRHHDAQISDETVQSLVQRIDALLQWYDQPEAAPLSDLLVQYWQDCADTMKAYTGFSRYRAMFRKFSSLRSSGSSDDVISILQTLSSPDSMPDAAAV